MNDRINKLKAFVGITAITDGVSLGVVALIAIFSPEQLQVAVWIVALLCSLGVGLGYLTTKELGCGSEE